MRGPAAAPLKVQDAVMIPARSRSPLGCISTRAAVRLPCEAPMAIPTSQRPTSNQTMPRAAQRKRIPRASIRMAAIRTRRRQRASPTGPKTRSAGITPRA